MSGKTLFKAGGAGGGARGALEVAEGCARSGLPVLTLYAFSLDNWKRPREEVDFLMGLLRQYVRRELDYMRRNNVRLRVIGRWQELTPAVVADVARAVEE